MEQCQRMLQTLARFHAEWWDDPRLGVSVGTWLDTDAIDRLVQRFEIQFKTFADRLGDRHLGDFATLQSGGGSARRGPAGYGSARPC
jgi:hypothetical protein